MNGKWVWVALSAVLGAILAIGVVNFNPNLGGHGPAIAGGGDSAAELQSSSSGGFAGDAQTTLENQIVVLSQGQVQVVPDTAMISLGVQTVATTAQEAQSQNTQQMQAVIDKLKALGVKDEQMLTSGVNLYPEQDQFTGPENAGDIVRYRAMNQVTVTIPEVGRAAEFLDAAIGAGANSTGSVSFTIKDDSQYRIQAIGEAVKAARPKAEAVAKALGVTIRDVKVVEEGQSGPAAFGAFDQSSGLGGGAKTPIMPGQLSVVETVRVIFTY
ncbi:MAG: SIMPL domain-containing protein [Chloroflexi bacterium]|nr:SIMPL domain-containing protein [Chloroflexota bacterium]